MTDIRMGYNTDAMNVFRRLLQRDPSDSTALNELAYLSAAGKRQSMIGTSGAVWRAELSPDGTMTCRVTQVAQTFSNGVRFVSANGPSMLQSCGRSNFRQAASSNSACSA